MITNRQSSLTAMLRSRLLAAPALLAFVALAGATAHAGAAAGDGSKPTDGPVTPTEAGEAPDRPVHGNTAASPAAVAALTVIQRRIAEYVADHGTSYSFGSYVDPNTGRIVLETDARASVLSRLTRMSDPVKRREVSRAQVRRTTTSDTSHRRNDASPFWGGAGIKTSTDTCSSGYSVKTAAATTFSVTAGHCFATGENVKVESGLRRYGTVSSRRLPTVSGHAVDMELLGGKSYAGRVYSGGVTSTTSRAVVGAGAPSVDVGGYCHSGQATGEKCGHTVTAVDAQTCTNTGCKSPVIAFKGGTIQQIGDSGGAFYGLDSLGNALIRGHVISANATTGYVQSWSSVASAYNVSIVTG